MSKTLFFYLMATILLYTTFYTLGKPIQIGGDLAEDKKLQCVSYAPFSKDESPFLFDKGLIIDPKNIDRDLSILAQDFECIRTYSMTGLEAIPSIARKYGLKLYLGAWIGRDELSNKKEIDALIKAARENKDVIKAVIVGNEVLLRKELSGAKLANYLKEVKAELPDIPVTYADVWEFWLKNKEVASATDFITIHILPYWEDEPLAVEKTKEHIKKTVAEVREKMGDKEILIGETGWPSLGRTREEATASPSSQARFIREFLELAQNEGYNYNIIEAFDQPWKRINEGAVGGYWGIYDKDRNDKNVLKGSVSDLPDYKGLFFISLIILFSSLPFALKSKKTSDLLSIVILGGISGALLSLQAEYYLAVCRNFYEFGFATTVLLVTYALFIKTITALSSQKALEDSMSGRVFTIFIALFLISSIALAVDGRYREFDNYAFGLGALLFALFFRGNIEGKVAVFCALSLVGTAFFIALNETLLNIEALVWIAISLLLTYKLWLSSKERRFGYLKDYLSVTLLSAFIFVILRYAILEGSLLGETSTLKSYLGISIHLRVFGLSAIALSVVAFALKSKKLSLIAIVFSVASLALYNATYGALAIVIASFAYILGQSKLEKKCAVY